MARMGSSLVPILSGLIAQEELVIYRIGVVNDEANRRSTLELERRRIEARVIDVDDERRLLCLCCQCTPTKGKDRSDKTEPQRGGHRRETKKLLPMRISTSIATPMVHAQMGVDSPPGMLVPASA